MIALPLKGQIVSMEKIQVICAEYNFYSLWASIKRDPPSLPFKSDGCSGGWPDTWNCFNLYPSCFKHDLKYWAGYPEDDAARLIADSELMIDIVRGTNDISLATVMFAGVRAGGGAFWKKPYSFGFGRSGK